MQSEKFLHKDPLVLCLMGPTATGKTNLALALQKLFSVELISVDSALVYKDMDIGTAKPAGSALAAHHLVNIKDPKEYYSAADFISDTVPLAEKIITANKIPLFVGGTMMYFRALQQGLSPLPGANATIRKEIEQEAQQKGWQEIYQQLKKIDPIAAQRIHPNDPQRIQRAMEVYRTTGRPLSELQQAINEQTSHWQFLNIALMPTDRPKLHQTIARRFHTMLEQGFVAEVEQLFARDDLSLQLPSMRAVGYRQVWEFLDGKITYDEMVEKAIIATRQLAKRQITWLRSWPNIHEFDYEDVNLLEKVTQLLNTTLSKTH